MVPGRPQDVLMGRDSGRVSFRSPSGCGHHQDHGGCGPGGSLIGALLVAPILYAPNEGHNGTWIMPSWMWSIRGSNRYPDNGPPNVVHIGTPSTRSWDPVDEGLQ